jgi:hypothetical protein
MVVDAEPIIIVDHLDLFFFGACVVAVVCIDSL